MNPVKFSAGAPICSGTRLGRAQRNSRTTAKFG